MRKQAKSNFLEVYNVKEKLNFEIVHNCEEFCIKKNIV